MEVLKLSYEVNKLGDIVEERGRLLSDIGIEPSQSDDKKLGEQLGKVVGLLTALRRDN